MPARENQPRPRPLRSLFANFTRKERTILGLLAAALLWGTAAGTLGVIRGRAALDTSRPHLYGELEAALPDPGFFPERTEIEPGETGPPQRLIYLTRPPFPGEPEVEVFEDGWIFFPRDYYTTININRAGCDELVSLPGIGPVTAWWIIRYRQRYVGFSRVKALKKISGIGDKTLKRLEGRIRLY
jgi:competence ComEA-like helix-hairpin-helix protein